MFLKDLLDTSQRWYDIYSVSGTAVALTPLMSVSKNRVTLVVLLYFASISLVNTGFRSEYRL